MPLARVADNLNIVQLKYELEHLRQNNSIGQHSGILAPGRCKQRLLMVLQQSYSYLVQFLSLSFLSLYSISPSYHLSVFGVKAKILPYVCTNLTKSSKTTNLLFNIEVDVKIHY